jgi:seryl-tRNA synthetase
VIGIIWLTVKAKGDAKELVAKKSKLEQKKKDIQVDAESRKEALDKKVRSVGNIVDKSVPISQNEVSVSRFLRQLNLG